MRADGGLLIACALQKELRALEGRLQSRCQFLHTGLGAARTGARLEERFERQRPGLLLFTGMAGQLDPSLPMGQVVFPEEWCFEEGACFACDPELAARLRRQGFSISGLGLTVSLPVLRAKTRVRYHRRTGAAVCDMESAAALQVARRCGVPALAPKIVSDTAESGVTHFWRTFDDNMTRLAEYLDRLIACLAALERGSLARP